MSEPRISVALATHQGARFIAQQIESILNQTKQVDEIVLSDDASSDDTVEIVIETIERAGENGRTMPNLVVLRNDPPLRVTQNFAQAISHCTGDFIALCDQDDVWHPERVETLSTRLQQSNVQLVMSNARQIDALGRSLGHSLFEALGMSAAERQLLDTGQAYRQFLKRNLATGATVMLKRELAQRSMPFPDAWLHDEWLAMIAAATNSVAVCDQQLTDYRQHDANQVGMEKMGLRRKLRMFAQPRTERNRRLYERASALPERLRALPEVSREYVEQADQKFAFEQARVSYPAARLLRVKPIMQQWRSGNYTKYGTGLKDAIRNLLQPV